MAAEIRVFNVTTPPGVQISNPQITNLTMPPRIVRRIEVVVPRGCNGVLGFAFGAVAQNVLPINGGAWVVTSDEKLDWTLDNQIDSGAWQIQTYNVGNYPHTLNIRFHVDYPGQITAVPVVDPSAILALSSGPAGDTGEILPLGSLPGYGV